MRFLVLFVLFAHTLACSDPGAANDAPDAGEPPTEEPDAAVMEELECIGDDDCSEGRCNAQSECACPSAASIPSAGAWTRQVGAPLHVPGQSHTDDSTSYMIADPSALYDEATKSWTLWHAGLRGTCYTCENDSVIERAESADGVTWTTQDQPALALSKMGWDAIRTETPDVIVDPNAPPSRRFVMAYAGADVELDLGFPNYNIGLAFSSDGKTFTRLPSEESPHGESGLLLRETDVFPGLPEVDGGVVADPTLALVDGTYHMWFSSFGCGDGDTCSDIRTFGVSHATSSDGINWVPDPANPVVIGAEQPSVIWNPSDCQFEMWFTRHVGDEKSTVPSTFNPTLGAWRATSPDGSKWTVDDTRKFEWDDSEPAESLGLLTGVDVALKGRDRVLFYVGLGTTQVPTGSFLPVHTTYHPDGYVPGTFGLGIATQP